MYFDALKHRSESVKLSALRCLMYVPESTDIIIKHSRSGSKRIRVEAFKMLSEINSEAAADRIIEALRNGEGFYEEFYGLKLYDYFHEPQSELVRKLIQEGDSYLARYQQKRWTTKKWIIRWSKGWMLS